MYIRQFFLPGLGHQSYLLAGNKSCAIIDPRRDVDEYLRAAREDDLTIAAIFETHMHADYVSGGRELADRAGAKLYAARAANVEWTHQGLSEGDTVRIDDIEIRVMESPGHSPDHIVLLITDKARGDEPVAVFTGDTLFVGDVGRPDLYPDRKLELAGKLYDSLQRLLALPDFVEVYPSHGSGSLCGRSISDKRSTTIGYERRYNPELLHRDRDRFAQAVLDGLPTAPDHFFRLATLNRRGAQLLHTLPEPRPLAPRAFEQAMKDGVAVVDVRDYLSFAGGHVQGAYNISLAGDFATLAGWVLPSDRLIALVLPEVDRLEQVTTELHRVGLDQIAGWLHGGMRLWAQTGRPIENFSDVSVRHLREDVDRGSRLLVLDVRSPSEWAEGVIPGAATIEWAELRHRANELPRDRPVVTVCKVGTRAALAASLLGQQGFDDVAVLPGGMVAWTRTGGRTVQLSTSHQAAPASTGKV